MKNDIAAIYLPCGARAFFDEASGLGYRCERCFAMVGSIGQPQHCVTAANEYKMLESLGGKGWDYRTGKQVV